MRGAAGSQKRRQRPAARGLGCMELVELVEPATPSRHAVSARRNTVNVREADDLGD